MNRFIYYTLLFGFVGFFTQLYAQGKLYDGPDDPAGDPAAERYAWMTGNRVLIFFRNTTELSDCCSKGYDVSKWPNNFDGTKMHDGITLLLGARVFFERDNWDEVVEDPTGYSSADLDTLYYIQGSYREYMDKNPAGTVEWALYPVFGYFNELDEYPAMSNLPNSWPAGGWPTNNGLKWTGEWNGRFGRGVMKADQESFFVVNDAQDQEYLPTNPNHKTRGVPGPYYFPRGDVKIGHKNSNVTVQKGAPWGGLGLRVETRGFQWSNPSAMDAIFFEYNVSNISDYDLPENFFGIYMDNAVGGEEGTGDDIAFYSKELNMCYSWDIDFIPLGGGKEPGVLGLAYLESPGIPFDGVDNDRDGLIDEKRDNTAVEFLETYPYGVDNVFDFLSYYKLEEVDLRPHWDADEDMDWQDGFDKNDNGVYAVYNQEEGFWEVEPGERPGDDLGLDGVGPFDLNYTGPDEGECNHKPDYIEGVGCEPNFAATDISESDMLGLTSFRYCFDWGNGEGSASVMTDENTYLFNTRGIFDDAQTVPRNFVEQFASGLFPLFKGRTERISMSELHSYDPLAGLNSDEHTAPALFRLKEIVQQIYEADYRFAQPPLTPTLTATPQDGQVILTWDDAADTYTREAFLGNINDFEGYKLYRATDSRMADAEQITDGFGSPLLKKPIFQCDVVNNKFGFTDYGLINGAGYNLGYDNGLQHYFVDNTVQNGKTYYYVLVSYDYGIDSVGQGIPPSESTFVIELDEYENVRKISQNVAIVQPHQFAAGYEKTGVEEEAEQHTIGTGWASPELLVPGFSKAGHEYKITFIVDTLTFDERAPEAILYRNAGIRIYDATEGNQLVYEENKEDYAGNNFKFIKYDRFLSDYADITSNWVINHGKELTTSEFDGLIVNFYIPLETAQLSTTRTGWISGSANIGIGIAPVAQQEGEQAGFRNILLPYDYDIIFTANDSAYVTDYVWQRIWRTNESDRIIYNRNQILYDQKYSFYVVNRSLQDENGDDLIMDMVGIDHNGNGTYDPLEDEIFVGLTNSSGGFIADKWAATAFTIDFFETESEDKLPQPGDVYRVSYDRPFMETDTISFTVQGAEDLNTEKLNREMDDIRVVPNPYVASNTFEENVANYQLSQRRQLMFTNIPARSTIKIFTVSGVLVDVIEVDNAIANRSSEWDLNSEANGTAFWDLKTQEGLDIAAGYYIYHVKAHATGKEKMGKFAIIK